MFPTENMGELITLMQFPNNFEHYLKHKLKYGGGILHNTPTEEFENVLFWTFNKSVAHEYAMEFDFI